MAADHVGEIHLLLTDVVMPKMNGSELATKTRAVRPEAQVVFMSGYLGDELLGYELPPDDSFVAKPFSTTQLLEKIGTALGSRPSRD